MNTKESMGLATEDNNEKDNIHESKRLREDEMYTLHFDGTAFPNPGKGGVGIWITGPDKPTITKISETIPKNPCTNNEAEYIALTLGLETAYRLFSIKKLKVFGDSELIINQLNGVYNLKYVKMCIYK